LDLAELRRGETVLDVGCGTGTLALDAYERAGASGRVVGIDPAPRQLARARAKATRRGYPVEFQIGAVERLAFPDESFDVVLSTWMMHHLPDDLKPRGLAKIWRVLKPGGRLLIADAEHRTRQGQPERLGAGTLGIQDLPLVLAEAGFDVVKTEEVRLSRLTGFMRAGFLLARKATVGQRAR
jgi:ubiquinone/menaquinone biosynthesis C-methylase UbiE